MYSSAPPPSTFVGRHHELGLLRERLARALAGSGGLILIGGEAGIGKTALAEALCHAAAAEGAHILVGHCYDLSETPPYGPWIEALARAPTSDMLPPCRPPSCLPSATVLPSRVRMPSSGACGTIWGHWQHGSPSSS